MNKKILFISEHDMWGSKEAFSPMYKILIFLAEKGFNIEFVNIYKDKTIDESSLLYGEPLEHVHQNVHINRIKVGNTRFVALLEKIPGISRIERKLRREIIFPYKVYKKYKNSKNYDLIYAYEIYAVPIAKRLSVKNNIPLVTRFQGSFLWNWIDKYGEKYCKRKFSLHYKALATNSDLIIMTDDGTEGDKALKYLGNNSKTKFWKNGLDFKPIDISKEELRNKYQLKNDFVYTISVCRLAKWKKLERIIESYRYISKGDLNIKHIFVGQGEELEFLKKLINKYKLEDYFIFVGGVPHYLVAEYLQASDIFLSFFDSTNIGNPLQEAIKLNLPIVTYDVGDTKTMIDGTNGILLDNYEPEKVCDAVLRLINDQSYREFIINNVKCTSSKLWSWSERLEAEYQEIIKLL